MKSTFKILYYAKQNTGKKSGKLPLMVRLTINGESTQISIHLEVSPKIWHQKSGRTIGGSKEAQQINAMLDSITAQFKNAYNDYRLKGEHVTPELLKNVYLGRDIRMETLLNFFGKIDNEVKNRLGKDRARSTVYQYNLTYRRVKELINNKYHLPDLPLNKVNYEFIADFESLLKINHGLSTNSAGKLMSILKRVINRARNNGIITVNPFVNFHIGREDIDVGFLTELELKKIMIKDFELERMERVRDIFIFCCFTGLSYIDLFTLKSEHIVELLPGDWWIMKNREKTGVLSRIKLLSVPVKILNKYKGMQDLNGHILPVISNQKLNSYLKEISDVCGINKRLTFHMSRHTFATTVALANGVPMKDVSKGLGHKRIQQTELYARVLDNSIRESMNLLDQKIGDWQNPYK